MKPRIHPQAICETGRIGDGTTIEAFAHVLPGATIGRDCRIGEGALIRDEVVLGDRTSVGCGAQLWKGVRVGEQVSIGSNVVVAEGLRGDLSHHSDSAVETPIADFATIGANATIMKGVCIGSRAMVAAGSVVTRSVPPKVVVAGNPASICGYVDAQRREASLYASELDGIVLPGVMPTSLPAVTLHRMKTVVDLRGHLSVGQFGEDIPFETKRYFIVFGVPSEDVRGEHAHLQCEQFLICVKGSISVIVDDGGRREEIVLDRPDLGLYVPAMVWCTQYKCSGDAVLLVFASDRYDPGDYVRDYDRFLSLVADRQSCVPLVPRPEAAA